MTLILLLDLDDTLLTNRMQSFQTAYLKALGNHLSGFVEPARMVHELLSATQRMISNDRPDKTLKEVFDAHFYPAIGIKQQDIQLELDCFYSEVFPTLRSLTSPKPEAQKLIDLAMKKGWQIVVATNPLFPRTAILQRLDWAGFSNNDVPFDLISSYETFHFAKPNPSYYAEILAQLGSPTEPAIMVGNDLDMDISPARTLGLSTYWLDGSENDRTAKPPIATRTGSMKNLVGWLEGIDLQSLKAIQPSPLSLLATLRATPAALSTSINSIPKAVRAERSIPSEWSFTEILCHLRDVDREVNLSRLKKLTTEENPFLPGIDTDSWQEIRQYRLQDGEIALNDFRDVRIEMIDLLENLSINDWQRISRHAIFGPTTLIDLVRFIVSHDQDHLRQWHKVFEAR